MKVMMINGSTHEHGCTYTALSELAKVFHEEGVETELLWLGAGPVQDCIACAYCSTAGKCVYDNDAANRIVEKAADCDGFVFGSPVYYAHPSGRILSILDRVFYAGSKALRGKPGAAVVSARRAGTSASLDVLNKYFTIAEMPVVSSSYWNMVHGAKAQDVLQDAEGLQTMRNLARNMVDLMQRKRVATPQNEYGNRTNFIR